MISKDILSYLRGERGANPNRGVEEDDLLMSAFFDLPEENQELFWQDLADAMRILAGNKEDLPFYLACRFIYAMSEIKPPRKPRTKNLFDFLLEMPSGEEKPQILAGTLLVLLVFDKGEAGLWETQVQNSLCSLEQTGGDSFAMAAVVYAFLGLSRKTLVAAEFWQDLFLTLSRIPEVPRMELLELFVGVFHQQSSNVMVDEISVGRDVSTPYPPQEALKCYEVQLRQVFTNWLEMNNPSPEIRRWLEVELASDKTPPKSPRAWVAELSGTRAGASRPIQVEPAA